MGIYKGWGIVLDDYWKKDGKTEDRISKILVRVQAIYFLIINSTLRPRSFLSFTEQDFNYPL